MRGPLNHCGRLRRSSLSSATRSADSTASKLRHAVVLAHRRRDWSSLRRKQPVAPRQPVAAMQDSAHRQYVAGAMVGATLRSFLIPLTQVAAFAVGMRSSSTRDTPARSLNVIAAAGSCAWGAWALRPGVVPASIAEERVDGLDERSPVNADEVPVGPADCLDAGVELNQARRAREDTFNEQLRLSPDREGQHRLRRIRRWCGRGCGAELEDGGRGEWSQTNGLQTKCAGESALECKNPAQQAHTSRNRVFRESGRGGGLPRWMRATAACLLCGG
eukprot:7390067-Prymnesium_polylepis.1